MPCVSISAATAATHEIVPAVAGRRIRVLAYTLVAAGAVVVTWKSGSTAISGAMTLATGTPLPAAPGGNSFDPLPHLETAQGEALQLTLGGAVQVSGHLTYDVIT